MMLLKSYKRMTPELEQTLRENVHPLIVRKHDIIQPVGTVADQLYFVEKGLIHLYLDSKGKQVTLRFKTEDQFIISLKQLFPDEKAHGTGIEALEDSILWTFPGHLVSSLKEKFDRFRFQFGIIIMKDWVSIEEAGRCSHRPAGSHNYDQLCKYSPELLDRVPISYLANYTNLPEKKFRHLHSTKIELNISTTTW